MLSPLFCLSTLVLLVASSAPQQIHISLTDKPDEMTIMWTTATKGSEALVQYGLSKNSLTLSTDAYNSTQYSTGDYESGVIYTAMLTGLKPSQKYYYRVGDGSTWSDVNYFLTDRQFPVSFIAIADVGTSPYCHGCTENIATMISYSLRNPVDFMIHSGDISYANGEHKIWDEFESQIEPLTSRLPYMVSVGNHEVYDNWEAFCYRYTMPAQESGANAQNFYYSFNYGPVHVISLDSERGDFSHDLHQYQWLEADLQSVDRSVTPWIFVSFHRPWYCSNTAHPGSGDPMRNSYEDLFYKYGVDVNLVGHAHAYERTKPMYKGAIDPNGIVTIVNGNGGDHEHHSDKHWHWPQPDWSAYREAVFGFGTATVYNATHLHWQMIVAADGSVRDDWWFVRQH